MQTRCIRVPLRPGTSDRFVAWLESARGRRDEMIDAMAAEGLDAELLLVERRPEGDAVLLFTRGADLEAANAAFAASTRPIDVETRAVIAATWDLERATMIEVGLDLVGPVRGR